MDPNKILDEKTRWDDDVDLGDYEPSLKGQKGYVHVTTYANGKKVVELYKYGQPGETQDPLKTLTTIDPDVKKDFDNPPPTKNIGGQVMQFNPETGQYDKPLGSATTSASSRPVDIKIEEDPSRPGTFRKITRTIDKDGNGIAVVGNEPAKPDEVEAAGLGKSPTTLAREAADARTAATNDRIAASQAATTAETARHNQAVENKPTVVDLPTGGKASLIPDPKSPTGFRLEPIAGLQSPTLPAGIGQFQPDPTKPGYGLWERRAALLDLVSNGTITEQQYNDILKEDHAQATSLATQATAIVNGAQTAHSDQLTQRSQDITQADARLNAANTQSANAMSFANQNAVGLARSGIKDIFSPIMRSQALTAQRLGGLETPAHIPLPKALQTIASLDIPGVGTLNIHGAGEGGAATGGAPAAPDAAPAADPSQQAPQAAPPVDSPALGSAHPLVSAWDDDPEIQAIAREVAGVGA